MSSFLIYPCLSSFLPSVLPSFLPPPLLLISISSPLYQRVLSSYGSSLPTTVQLYPFMCPHDPPQWSTVHLWVLTVHQCAALSMCGSSVSTTGQRYPCMGLSLFMFSFVVPCCFWVLAVVFIVVVFCVFVCCLQIVVVCCVVCVFVLCSCVVVSFCIHCSCRPMKKLSARVGALKARWRTSSRTQDLNVC